MMRRLVLLCLGSLFLLSSANAGDWPHWRGTSRNGVLDEPSGWKDGRWPLKDRWKTNVGEGSSSPIVVGGRLYVMGYSGGRDHVRCLDAGSGKPIWQVSYRSPRYPRFSNGDKSMYSGPTSTPEYDKATGYLYTLSTDGLLNCWDAHQKGKKVWSRNLYDDYGAKQRPQVGRSGLRDYGYTSSPLLFENSLIVEVGSPKGTVIGFDKRTGKERWRSEHRGPAGHNGGPALMTVENVPCLAVHHHFGLLVIRLDAGNEGKTIAEVPWLTEFANNIASPSAFGDSVIITSAYNHKKMARYRITLKGAKKVWQNDHCSKVCSPVIHKGYVYWAWRTACCVDFETGRTVWESRGYSDPGSCVVTSDDRLIFYSGKGFLTLAKTASDKQRTFEPLAKTKSYGRAHAWPHVVLASGKLYCKDRNGTLVCLELSK